MEQAFLSGFDNRGLARSRAQLHLFALMAVAQANKLGTFSPASISMLTNNPRFEKKTYFACAQVSGGSSVANDILGDLPSTEKIGVCNFNQKKISDNEVLVVGRIELQYAECADSITTASNDLVSTLIFNPITDAPAALLNGEVEFLVKESRLVRLPISMFQEPVAGTQSARPFGVELDTFPLIQSNENIGVKVYTASALPSGNRYFVRVALIGDAARPKV